VGYLLSGTLMGDTPAKKKRKRKKQKGKVPLNLIVEGGSPDTLLTPTQAKKLLAEQRRMFDSQAQGAADLEQVEQQGQLYRALPWILGSMVVVWFLIRRKGAGARKGGG